MIWKSLIGLFRSKDLWSAAERGDIEAIRHFVATGTDVNSKKKGWTALHYAAERGQVESIRELARLAAKIDARDDQGYTPLMLAKNIEQICLLLELGADVNKHTKAGATALEYAALCGSEEKVKLLLSNGASPNAPKGKDFVRSPIVAAVEGGSIRLLEALLKANAAVNPEPGKDSALDIAALRGRIDLVRRLLAVGADPNHKDSEGRTPLMSAVRGRNADVVRALLDAGADVSVRSNDQKSSLDRALEMKLPAIIKMLQTADAEHGKEAAKLQAIAEKDNGSTFWQLPYDFIITATIEPLPLSAGDARLKVEISENEYNQSFSGRIDYRVAISEKDEEEWFRLLDGEKDEGGSICFSVPVALKEGENFIQFRICDGNNKDFICPEAWKIEV